MSLLNFFTFKHYIGVLNGIAVVVHTTNVILLGIYHMGYTVPLRYSETTFSESTHDTHKINDQAYQTFQHWADVNVATLFMMNEGIALFSALLGCFNTINSNNDKIIYYETIRRWIEFGLTAAFLEVILLLILGETDLFSLCSIFLLIVIQQITGYLVDTEKQNGTHKFLYFFIGFIVLIYQQTFVICKTMTATGISNRDKWAIMIVNAVMYSLFGLHQYFGDASTRYSTRINKHTYFILLSFCTKTLVTWLAFTSLKHTIEKIQPKYIEYDIDWEEAFNIVLYVVLSFFVVGTGLIYTIRPNDLKEDVSSNKRSSTTQLLPQQTIPEPVPSEIQYTARDVLGMGSNIPMLGPDSYTETDNLL